MAIAILGERRSQPLHLCCINPAIAECDFLGATDLESLPILDGLDEIGRLVQRLVGSRIQPGEATPQLLQLQRIIMQVALVEVGDFQFATR